jgi:organic radical activating enzyme
MASERFEDGRPLLRMPYETAQTPHMVLEVNQACNITCEACYKAKSGKTKPVDDVIAEIDWIIERRKLDVITVAGGEPTLHPQLADIVRYIADRGILVQMLTNGTLLTDERLDELAAAGMFKIYLHIDTHQRRDDTDGATTETGLNAVRERIAQRVRRHGIGCAPVLTLYQSNLGELDAIVEHMLASPSMDWLLSTLYTDFTGLSRGLGLEGTCEVLGEGLPDETVTNEHVAPYLMEKRGWHPSAYVASSRRDRERRWLFYYALVIRSADGSFDVHYLDQKFGRNIAIGNWMYKLQHGRYPFDILLTPFTTVIVALCYAALSFNPITAFRVYAFLLKAIGRGRKLELKAMAFQQGPNLTPEGELEFCRFCPDATVRDGQLIPVCLVDVLRPPGEDLDPERVKRADEIVEGLWS